MKSRIYNILALLVIVCTLLSGCSANANTTAATSNQTPVQTKITQNDATQAIGNQSNTLTDVQITNELETSSFILTDVSSFTGSPYVVVNGNVPYFSDTELTTTSFEYYSELDSLGRCGVAYANIGQDLMPTTKRGEIGSVKPSGWHIQKYDCVDGKYLYNRCHLIGYQLSGENANTKNLITGTRYMNVEGMLIFENMVADYVKETGNHVLYRVTPIFDGDNLVASGVLMEAESVEDRGVGVLFNVYCYNNQPGITIDYATGESKEGESQITESKEINNNAH